MLYGPRPNSRRLLLVLSMAAAAAVVLVASGCGSSQLVSSGIPGGTATTTQVVAGRYLVLGYGCAGCHNRGKVDPTDPLWLAGYTAGTQGQPFTVLGFQTYASNLTVDTTTGIGSYTDLQIYNALKFGLDPAFTASQTITSSTPGQGNYPAQPHYLAPPMPWPSYQHLDDVDLWSIVSYLKHGIKAVSNTVPPSQAPADFWASYYSVANVGPSAIPAYPEGNEVFSP